MNIFKGKKIFAVLIVLTLVLSSVPINSVNAKTNINNSEISVQLVNSTSIKVVAGKQTGYISVTKAKNGIKYVKGFESGKKPIVLKVDTKNGTVTSKNGVVFKINSVASDGKKARYVTKKYSYARIKNALGGASGVMGVATALAAFLSALGLTVPGMIPQLLTYLGGITGLISLVMRGSRKHGIKIRLKNYMKIIYHRGKRYRIEAWKVVSVRKY